MSFNLGCSKRAPRTGGLFEHFLVLGYPPTIPINVAPNGYVLSPPSQQAAILYQYPEHIPLSNNEVCILEMSRKQGDILFYTPF